MANTDIICIKLINQIIKTSGQQVSDRHLIKRCLNNKVLSQKKLINNQLVKQSGIKSQYCTISHDLVNQPQPTPLKKDEFMFKSLQTFLRKKAKPKITVQKGKSLSNRTVRRKVENKEYSKNFKQTKITFANSQQANQQQKFIKLKAQEIQISRRSSVTSKKRRNLVQQKKKYKELKMKTIQYQSSKQKAATEERRRFQKQLASVNAAHTYHTNGKYEIYSINNQQRAIEKVFPVYLGQQVYDQQIIVRTKRGKNHRSYHYWTEQRSPRNMQNQELELNHSIYMDTLYNNNYKRQTSSTQYVQPKSGVCFTQPSQGKSVRGDFQSQSTYLSFKPKSTFSKFFLNHTDCSNSQIEGDLNKNLTGKSKTEHYNKFFQFESKIFSARRPKSGKIKDINEKLYKKLIVNI